MMRAQLLVLMACLLIVGGANFWPHELPSEDLARAEILEATDHKSDAAEIYSRRLRDNPADVELNRAFIRCRTTTSADHEERLAPLLYDLKTRDQALYCQGYARSVLDDDPVKALERFRRVKNQQLPYLQNSLGYCLEDLNRFEPAEAAYRAEVAGKVHADMAVNNLCSLYFKRDRPELVAALLADPETAPHVERSSRILLAYQQREWLTYCWLVVQEPFLGPAVPLASAVLIAIMWLVLLKRIDAFEPEPTWALLTVFGLGCLSVQIMITPGHGLMNFFDPRSAKITDIYYAVFHVGVVEEITKLLPVLLFAAVSRQLNEPLDFLIYGSASALGFATVENADYFQQFAYTDVMITRFTLCVIGHMTYTSLICYTWARFRLIHRRSRPVAAVAALVAFGLAIVWHGLYDNLGSGMMELLGLLEALLYGWMLADGLSHSPFFHRPDKARGRLRNDQLIECTALLTLLIPYLWWDLTVSTTLANEWLAGAAWNWLLILTYFVGVEFVSLRRHRELWLSHPEAGASALEGSVQLLRALLVLSGFTMLVGHAFELTWWMLLAYFGLTLGVFGLYFRGAYGGLRSPREWWARPGQTVALEEQLTAAGLERGEAPRPASQVRHALVLGMAWVLTACMLVTIGVVITRGGDPLPIAVPFMIFTAPLVWARPHFVGAWQKDRVWAWVYLRGKRPVVMLWSRLPYGQRVTAAELSPWLVRPRDVDFRLHPGLSLDELLERHGTEGLELRSCEEDFREYAGHVRGAFLAAPIRETLKAFARALWSRVPRLRRRVP